MLRQLNMVIIIKVIRKKMLFADLILEEDTYLLVAQPPGPEVIKLFSSSAEHEISTADKC